MGAVADLQEWLGPATSRSLHARRCKECRSLIATGVDEEVAAFGVAVDPTSLTALGEVEAILAGLRCYTITRPAAQSVRATRRSRWLTPTSRIHDVWPEHRCGQLHLHTTTSRLERRRPTDPNDPCPF